MLSQKLVALLCHAVFLQAAAGLIWNGHLNQTLCKGWLEVTFTEGFAILQAKGDL